MIRLLLTLLLPNLPEIMPDHQMLFAWRWDINLE